MEDLDTRQFSEPTPEPKDKISDITMGRLISAFGNNEAKAFTLLVMDKGELYNLTQLHKRFVDFQGQEPGWVTNSTVQITYCSKSLSPIGLVVKEELQTGSGKYGYRLSIKDEMGQLSGEKGQLLAALLLDFSTRYPDVSLFDLFGSTTSSGKKTDTETAEEPARAPIRRWKIFKELATTNLQTIRQADLVHETGIPHGELESHLLELSRKNIVDYDYIEFGNPVSYYFQNPNHPDYAPQTFASYPAPTQRVYEIFSQNSSREMTIEEVTGKYIQLYDTEKKLDPKSLRTNVNSILSHLKNHGYLQQGEYGQMSRSTITTTPDKQEMLLDLVSLLGRFQDQDPEILKEAEALIRRLRQDEVTSSTLMKKARKHSPFANRRDPSITVSLMRPILEQNPNISTRELQERMAKENGIELGRRRIRVIRSGIENN